MKKRRKPSRAVPKSRERSLRALPGKSRPSGSAAKSLKGQIRRAQALGYTFDKIGRARKGKKLIKVATVRRALARAKPARPAKPAKKRVIRPARPVRVITRKPTKREKRLAAENVRLKKALAKAKAKPKPRPRPEPPLPPRKPLPKPTKKPPRITKEDVDHLTRAYEKQFDRIQLQGGSEPDWGWGRRAPNPKVKTDAGSDALQTEALITSKAEQKEALEYVANEMRPTKGKSYTLSFTIIVRMGDELGIDGSNQKTIGRGADAVMVIFDKLDGEFDSPEEAYDALSKRLDQARRKGGFFYLERVLIHAHK